VRFQEEEEEEGGDEKRNTAPLKPLPSIMDGWEGLAHRFTDIVGS